MFVWDQCVQKTREMNWIQLNWIAYLHKNSHNNEMLLVPCIPVYTDTRLCNALLSNYGVSFAHVFVLVC